MQCCYFGDFFIPSDWHKIIKHFLLNLVNETFLFYKLENYHFSIKLKESAYERENFLIKKGRK